MSRPRARSWITAFVAIAGCSSPSPVTRSAAPRVHEESAGDPAVAAEVGHGEEVPAANDRHERLVLTRGGSIWMMGPDASDPLQLTVRPLDAPDADPAFSTAAAAVAYASLERRVYRLFVVSLDDMMPRAITDGGRVGDHHPAWSPDARVIAFMRGDPRDRLDLYVADVPAAPDDDARPAPFAAPLLLVRGDDDDPERVGRPAYSPDGRVIVFSADRREGKGTALWQVDVTTHAMHRLSPVPARAAYVADLEPSYSPDGSRIVFASNRHVSSADHDDFDIYSVAADGSGLTRLTNDPGSAREPVYSPDGKRIFFASTRDRQRANEWEIYVMSAGGGRTRRLTRDERPQNRAPSTGLAK
jgi:dipeptidyl aminopeptidase/acylaminoacyl peptidase